MRLSFNSTYVSLTSHIGGVLCWKQVLVTFDYHRFSIIISVIKSVKSSISETRKLRRESRDI